MDKFPPEILSDIFLRNIPHNHEPDHVMVGLMKHKTVGTSVLVPLCVSHVCRYWRDVSLSCGELWSYLQIHFRNKEHHLRRAELELKRDIFDTWLSRTSGSPLNFLVHCKMGDIYFVELHRVVEHFVTTLASQQHRWKNMSLAWHNPPDFPGLVLTNMPMLTSLSLSFSLFVSSKSTELHGTISIAQSPRLKKLYLKGNFRLESGTVPIPTLTEPCALHFLYDIQNSPRDCVSFLGIAPYLNEFEFSILASEISSLPRLDNNPPISHTHIRDLKANGRFSPLVLDQLTLPSLEVFCSEYSGSALGSDLRQNFFRRSPLTKLELESENVDVYTSSLRFLTNLEILKMWHPRVSESFFRELVVPDDVGDAATAHPRAVCPSLVYLELLEVRVEGGIEACINALLSMGRSRAEILGTLTTGTLHTNGFFAKITNLVKDDAGWNVDNLRRTLKHGRLIIEGRTNLRKTHQIGSGWSSR